MYRDTFDPVLHSFLEEYTERTGWRASELGVNAVRRAPLGRRVAPWRPGFRRNRRGTLASYGGHVGMGGPVGPHPIYAIAEENGSNPKLSLGRIGDTGIGSASDPTAGTGAIYEVQRYTSATLIAPTQQAEYLVGLVMEQGAINGSLAVVYDGIHSAAFPAPSGGLSAAGTIGPPRLTYFPMNIGPLGSGVPANVQTYTQLVAIYAIMSNMQNPYGHQWAEFRGVPVSYEASAASAVSQTFTIPGVQARPLGYSALLSLAATATGIPYAYHYFPAVGSYTTYKVPATQDFDAPFKVWPVPYYDPATSFAVYFDTISLGGATDIWHGGFLWY